MLILSLYQKPRETSLPQISFNQQCCKLLPDIYFSQNILSFSQPQYSNLLWSELFNSSLSNHVLSWPNDLYFFQIALSLSSHPLSQKSHWRNLVDSTNHILSPPSDLYIFRKHLSSYPYCIRNTQGSKLTLVFLQIIFGSAPRPLLLPENSVFTSLLTNSPLQNPRGGILVHFSFNQSLDYTSWPWFLPESSVLITSQYQQPPGEGL